ncbi:helix-hairpin-helix domain-containing protein [Streptomyces sp. HSG2]|uniref:helix-hairpin-helix domain-containing protein n=1 Tax=Streptomyces sp. HSG2 TaxID=2797167 RepID=UPI001F5BE32D|nr:helix-hairpin-helix domain-containing protein [Streptomyces sp. HSG2]
MPGTGPGGAAVARGPIARERGDAREPRSPDETRRPSGSETFPEERGAPPGRGRRVVLALVERLPLWLQTRCALERRGAVALGLLFAAVSVFAVHHYWTGRTHPVGPPEVVRPATAAGPVEEERPPPVLTPRPGGPGFTPPGAEIVVDVGGEVRRPGVHRLPAGSRVEDALRAAGGVRGGTETEGLNRARFLVDGEQVLVGIAAVPPPPGDPREISSGPAGELRGGAPLGPVSLNTATPDQLDTLPGVGPVLARRIVEHRARNGGFRSVEELREVNGIGDRRFADLSPLVRP